MPTKEADSSFGLGALLAVLGLYVIVSDATKWGNWTGGFFLVGLGVVFMATSNSERQKQFWDFIFSIFKDLWHLLSGR